MSAIPTSCVGGRIGERYRPVLCGCSCGELAPLHRNGWPQQFIRGHQNRKPLSWEERDCGYETPCHVWTSSILKTGYGCLTRNGKTYEAHRWSWAQKFGPIPKGMYVCHKCDNRPCVRPDHLFLGTARDNVVDMWSKGRGFNPGKDSRPKNHPRGEAHCKAIITEDQARAIFNRHKAGGISERKLAEQFGVSRGVVARVVKRTAWKHVNLD